MQRRRLAWSVIEELKKLNFDKIQEKAKDGVAKVKNKIKDHAKANPNKIQDDANAIGKLSNSGTLSGKVDKDALEKLWKLFEAEMNNENDPN